MSPFLPPESTQNLKKQNFSKSQKIHFFSIFLPFLIIFQNQGKLSAATEANLHDLKALSVSIQRLNGEHLHMVCPVLADLCGSLDTFHRDTTECYDTLGRLEPDFRLKEDHLSYTKSTVFEPIWGVFDPFE